MCFFFFFNDTATTEIYTLSLHDALPILATMACGWSASVIANKDEQSALYAPLPWPSAPRVHAKRLHSDASRRSSAGAVSHPGGRLPGAKIGASAPRRGAELWASVRRLGA